MHVERVSRFDWALLLSNAAGGARSREAQGLYPNLLSPDAVEQEHSTEGFRWSDRGVMIGWWQRMTAERRPRRLRAMGVRHRITAQGTIGSIDSAFEMVVRPVGSVVRARNGSV
jgi:hypothetical protein